MLALISLSSEVRDYNGASVATGHGGNSEDSKVKLSYSTLSLPPTVVAILPPDGTLAPLVMVGCTATAAGRFGSVVLFAVALVGVLCSD